MCFCYIRSQTKADAHSATTIAAKFGIALTVDIFSALCAYPLDTVRRSMMMMSGRKDKLYTTSAACFSHIWKEVRVYT